ncbi:MAG TPA: glycosyltransferase family 39 protein [Opitutaceae bacterium]|nr:glycosyltransferase family 39 protein [Opitutaceae bacterium]
MSNEPDIVRHRWVRRLTGPLAAAVVLATFWGVMLSSLREKSLTSDEIVHATAGYTYWKYRDYRLNPENGILPQRVMALPLILGNYQPPPLDSEAWRGSDEWGVADIWFHQMGNDLPGMLRRGRGAVGALTVLLGALVWHTARRLFGPVGGMISLLVFVASPIVLANGALMTSDATCSLFFLASTLGLWAMLHRLTAARVLISALLIGGLFVSKMSAVLMLPIGLALVTARLIRGQPLWIGFGIDRELASRAQQASAFTAAIAVHLVIVPVVIWGFYGFRYAAFGPSATAQDRFQHPWEFVLEEPGAQSVASAPPALAAQAFEFVRQHQLLPEAYVYGYAHAWRFSRVRSAFFNGEYGISGWKAFFPYTFLVKTPLPMFAILLLAAAAAFAKWRDAAQRTGTPVPRQIAGAFHATLPLWALLVVYWAAVIPSRLNIGHRHIMATYAPLFILCGASAHWLEAWWSRARAGSPVLTPGRMAKSCALALGGLVIVLFAEMGFRYPHYLAYFNGIVAPSKGYRHLVDSSLDWGQDLPGVKRYLDSHPQQRSNYLSYFGTASPAYYGISARILFSAAGWDLPRTPLRELLTPPNELATQLAVARNAWPDCEVVTKNALPDGRIQVLFLQQPALPRLGGGTYFVSATMLPAIWFGPEGPLGPWNARFEATYQELSRAIQPLLVADAQLRAEALAKLPVTRWTEIFESFAQFRFARLTAYLRQREPDGQIGFSILVYQLTDADLERALHGPPPELGVDFPRLLTQRGEL